MRKKLICLCSMVTEKEIIDAFKKGASTTKDIQKMTTAGTTCGRCLPQIDQLAEDFNSKDSRETQLRMDM